MQTGNFFVMCSKTGQKIRKASESEILAWGIGQTHPMFLRGYACFDHPVRTSETESTYWDNERDVVVDQGSWAWL